MNKDLELRQSQVIEAMRFPLIILVLFMHMLPSQPLPLSWQFSGMGIYNIISEMISHNFGNIAVPCFFLFSGFFFFYNKKEFNLSFYINQWRKRLKTILLPYFIWNIGTILVIVVKNYVFIHLGKIPDSDYHAIQQNSIFNMLWCMPADYPLWFLRDLIVMSLLSPLFRLFFKYTKVYGLMLLFFIYWGGFDSNIPGFSMTAILFFGTGVYLAVFNKNMLEVCSRWRSFTTVAAFTLLCVSTYCNGSPYHLQLVRLFVPFGIVAVINLIDLMTVCSVKLKNFLCVLSPTVFFIYAIHEIYILGFLNGFFYRTSLVHCVFGMILRYMLFPFIILIICLALYYLLKITTPRLLSVLVGGRIHNQSFNIREK